LIETAKASGCDAVKFQKRTPEICVPKDQWNIERDTPWGRMTYIDYRYKVEFGKKITLRLTDIAKRKVSSGLHRAGMKKQLIL
jgi:N-acetylneuraminate synthase